MSKKNQLALFHVYDPLEQQPPKHRSLPIALSQGFRWLNTLNSHNQQLWQQPFDRRKQQLNTLAQFPNISLLPAATNRTVWQLLQQLQHWWQ